MTPIEHIRRNVFRVSQELFGDIAGVSQATVSRWESGQWEPNRDELERIRREALARDVEWDDRLFFETPAVAS